MGLRQLEGEMPGVRDVMFGALKNVSPTYLLDKDLLNGEGAPAPILHTTAGEAAFEEDTVSTAVTKNKAKEPGCETRLPRDLVLIQDRNDRDVPHRS